MKNPLNKNSLLLFNGFFLTIKFHIFNISWDFYLLSYNGTIEDSQDSMLFPLITHHSR